MKQEQVIEQIKNRVNERFVFLTIEYKDIISFSDTEVSLEMRINDELRIIKIQYNIFADDIVELRSMDSLTEKGKIYNW